MIKTFNFELPSLRGDMPEFTFTVNMDIDNLKEYSDDRILYLMYKTMMDHIDESILPQLDPKHINKRQLIIDLVEKLDD